MQLGDKLLTTHVPCGSGAAMVYLHEIALPEYKSVTGSLGYVSLGIGVVLGILVVAAVIYTVTGGGAGVGPNGGWQLPDENGGHFCVCVWGGGWMLSHFSSQCWSGVGHPGGSSHTHRHRR
mgnify:CR=1 FL=1